MKPTRRWPFAAVLVTAAFFLGDALWTPAKAELAQFLLERAWRKNLAGEEGAKPWPWADTTPVGILEAPRLGIREMVLSGASGRNLAFGPVLHTAGGQRDLVLSGHRDTHFRFLRDLRPGDRLRLTTRDSVAEFTVQWREVVDSHAQELLIEPGVSRLTLMTCWPFDALTAGGPLRYVVTAVPARSVATAGPEAAFPGFEAPAGTGRTARPIGT